MPATKPVAALCARKPPPSSVRAGPPSAVAARPATRMMAIVLPPKKDGCTSGPPSRQVVGGRGGALPADRSGHFAAPGQRAFGPAELVEVTISESELLRRCKSTTTKSHCTRGRIRGGRPWVPPRASPLVSLRSRASYLKSSKPSQIQTQIRRGAAPTPLPSLTDARAPTRLPGQPLGISRLAPRHLLCGYPPDAPTRVLQTGRRLAPSG